MSRFGTDLLRILSVTFIIFNHVSWSYFARNGTSSQMPMDMLVAFFNQLGKPSVLIFIFLSGLAFARHRMNARFHPLTFYKNRASRILPPYLLATFLGIYFFDTASLNDIIPVLFAGGGMYHLYFVALISYCYLLFPIMRKIPPTRFNIVLGAGSFLLLHFFLAVFFPSTTNPELSYFLKETFQISQTFQVSDFILNWIDFLSYAILFFQSGIWIGRKNDREKSRRILFFITASALMTAAFAFVYTDFFFRIHSGVHADPAGRVWRMSVLLYAASWIFLLRNIKKDSNPFMRRMARASFLVYLFHPFLINMTKSWGYSFPVLHTAGIISASWILSVLLQEIALRFHFAGFLLGEGDKLIEKKDPPAPVHSLS